MSGEFEPLDNTSRTQSLRGYIRSRDDFFQTEIYAVLRTTLTDQGYSQRQVVKLIAECFQKGGERFDSLADSGIKNALDSIEIPLPHSTE